jgi:hypothetical protein
MVQRRAFAGGQGDHMRIPATCREEAVMSDTEKDAEQRIRERAYLLWLEEGRPEGRAEAHWKIACMLDAEREAYVDAEGEDSFPASDPPSHTPVTGDRQGGG